MLSIYHEFCKLRLHLSHSERLAVHEYHDNIAQSRYTVSISARTSVTADIVSILVVQCIEHQGIIIRMDRLTDQTGIDVLSGPACSTGLRPTAKATGFSLSNHPEWLHMDIFNANVSLLTVIHQETHIVCNISVKYTSPVRLNGTRGPGKILNFSYSSVRSPDNKSTAGVIVSCYGQAI